MLKPVSYSTIYANRLKGITDFSTPVDIGITFSISITIFSDSKLNISLPLTQFILDTSLTLSCQF
jgi:hypothetical protein